MWQMSLALLFHANCSKFICLVVSPLWEPVQTDPLATFSWLPRCLNWTSSIAGSSGSTKNGSHSLFLGNIVSCCPPPSWRQSYGLFSLYPAWSGLSPDSFIQRLYLCLICSPRREMCTQTRAAVLHLNIPSSWLAPLLPVPRLPEPAGWLQIVSLYPPRV